MNQPEPRCFRIIRHYKQTQRKRVIRNNVTATEAKNHCHRPDTKGEGWFDGFDYMPGCHPKG